MPYRQAAEMPGMNWRKLYEKLCQQDKLRDPRMAEALTEDNFTPQGVNLLQESDLPKLVRVSQNLYRMGLENSYNWFYWQLTRKAIVLLLEQFPEAFETLPEEVKNDLVSAKLEMPDEMGVFQQIHQYTQKRTPLPAGTFDTGVTLKVLLERIAVSDPDLLDSRMINALCSIDGQYGIYFLDNIPRV